MQDLGYVFDPYGNLTSREDFAQGVYESFTYDGLNRLTGSTLSNAETEAVLSSKSYRYDAVGNMMNKSDVGASDYVYGTGNAGPHAVTAAGGHSYTYDASGNMVSGAGRTLTWTSFQKPLTMAKGSTTSTFEYGPDRKRTRQVKVKGAVTETVTYVGGLYEQVSKTGVATEHVHYVFAGGMRIAVETASEAAGSNAKLRYLHQDHLGSVDVVTNESGAVVERLSFGAFGERRVAQGTTTWQDSALALSSSETRRGFTDHEQLDDFGLVHMNGRIYDPYLGRFLSADPFVQFALSSQGYNRYTYANNNPLSFTDPSGYFSLGGFFGGIIESIFTPAKWARDLLAKNDVLRIAVSVGFAFYGGPNLAGLLGFGAESIGAAVVGGFGSGLIASGGDLKSAVVGGLTAGAFNFVGGSKIFGDLTELTTSRVVAHGVIGGVSSELMGGKFGAGFFSAGFSKLTTPYLKGIPTAQARVVASAVIGGTASEIAGGKFANGAMTAAFGRLYNEEMSQRIAKQAARYMAKALNLNAAMREIPNAKLGLGHGIHLREFKLGPFKIGFGVVFSSGGVNLDSEGLSVWGASTADATLVLGDSLGVRAYLWDIDINSFGVNNLDLWGAQSVGWDWSVGVSGTISPLSFEFELDFQPIVDEFSNM